MSPPASASSTSPTNSYPFKDALFTFISDLQLGVSECTLIRKTRPGAETSSSLRSLKRYLSSYAAALSDEYNYHHTGRIGSRIETGDSIAIFDIEKSIAQLRTFILSPLNGLSVGGRGARKGEFRELKDTAVAICDDVLRVIEYLAERLERRARPEQKDPFMPLPKFEPVYDSYYTARPARSTYSPAPESYYGVRPQYTAPQPQPQPQYVAVRDPYGRVVLVRSRR
jgi:hypothetical protein